MIRQLGWVDFQATYQAMQDFTAQRDSLTPDEIWLCEHPPVFTQGLAGLASHVLGPTSAPLVATNRGGQVTFHGPGQVVAYLECLGAHVVPRIRCVLSMLEQKMLTVDGSYSASSLRAAMIRVCALVC